MGRLFLILICLCPFLCTAQDHPFNVEDLLNVSSLTPKNSDEYLNKKGFSVKRRSLRDNQMGYSFFENKKPVSDSTPDVHRRIDMFQKGDAYYISLKTSSETEFADSRSRLKRMGFFWNGKDSSLSSPLFFQKRTISVQAMIETKDDEQSYTITVKKKELPDPTSIQYADDLLAFDSHEYLVSRFGESNVKRDLYYFSEKESKRCSVLFPNTSDQAVFIWDDENNYQKLSYILIGGLLSTPGAVQYTGSFGQNRWMMKSGVYAGMRIRDLLKLNANDFEFYGNNSEYSLMVEPKVTGNINFKWMGVMLNCFNCDRSNVMNHTKVSASEAVNSDLSLHVSYIMLKP